MAEARIAIAMSGGVDSSAAAALLKDAGYDLVGFSMQLWDQKRSNEVVKSTQCCSLDDLYDAKTVASSLKIPHYILNFQDEFENMVVKSFVESYRNGLTPSPCVTCNSRMKFEHLARMAEEVHACMVATGHYARISHDEESGRYILQRARDKKKDQSYFLFELSQSQLAKAVFPLGDYRKDQVREIARKHGLIVADKSDSQEICFVPDGDYAAFVERYYYESTRDEKSAPFTQGQIVDTEGKVLGKHPGIHHFTIGQRRGLGIAHSVPLYVIDLHPEKNEVVAGIRSQLDKLVCYVGRPNWISIPSLLKPLRVSAKIRSRHTEAPATITPMDNGKVKVAFDSPQSAITPGQACVFYQSDNVVGGGWIERNYE